jgi:hypothetical protein
MYFAFMDHLVLWLIPSGLFGLFIAIWNHVDDEMDGIIAQLFIWIIFFFLIYLSSRILWLSFCSGQQFNHSSLFHLYHRLGHSLQPILEADL